MPAWCLICAALLACLSPAQPTKSLDLSLTLTNNVIHVNDVPEHLLTMYPVCTLPRDRRCAFTEHEQAKGVNVGKGLRRRNQQREVSRRANAGRAGAHPYRRRLAIRDIRDPVQRCVQPKYQTLLSLLPFAFIRVFGGQLFLIGLGVLLFKLSSLSFVGAVAPSGSRGSLEHRVAAR